VATATARQEGEENQLRAVDDDEDRVPDDDVSAARDRGGPDHQAAASNAQRYPKPATEVSKSVNQ